jgi:exonuclease SbcC
MTVLSRILGNFKAKPKSSEEQLADLAQLPMAGLMEIAAADGSVARRLAAIARLDYDPALIAFAFEGSMAGIQQASRQRLAALLDDGVITLAQLSTDGVGPLAQLAVVGFCEHDQLLKQLLDASRDEMLFYQIALEGVSAQARQLAVERIEDEGLLNQLLKVTKGKDKLVYKFVKAKCDGFRERDQQSAKTQIEIAHLCQRIEGHSKRSFDQFFKTQTEQLQAKWSVLKHAADAEITTRVEQAMLACQQTLDFVVQQQADLAAQEVAGVKAVQQQGLLIEQLRLRLAHLFDCPATESEIRSGQENVDACREQWQKVEQIKMPQKADEKAFTELVNGITFQLEQLQQQGGFQDQLAALTNAIATTSSDNDADARRDETFESFRLRLKTAGLLPDALLPESVSAALALVSQRQQQLTVRKDAEKHQMRQLSALIRRAQAATDAGQSREALGIRRSIEQKQSEDKALPLTVSKQLVALDAALEKLLDWKDYAVEPKKQQLIEQMRALVDSPENPEALAIKISRLQDDWKGLSKGAQDQAQWETFHQLSQTAYQPCKEFFEQQGKVRRDNLDRRIALVAQLQDYVSSQGWDTEDARPLEARAVEAVFAAAIREWRGYVPIERSQNQSVQNDFDRMLDLIRNQLNAHYQKNADIKRGLIDQALKLVDHEDNQKAIEAVKRLQAVWKATGPALRKEEQGLWKAFRAGCDALFEKRQQQNDAFKADLEVNKAAALALLDELKGFLALSGKALLEARAQVTACQQAFHGLGALPRGQGPRLEQDFKQLVERFAGLVAQQLQAAKEQVWQDLLTAADLIRLSQLSENVDSSERLGDAARTFIAGVEQWPKNGLKALEQKLARGAGDISLDENELALQRLCIRAEILCDRPTPETDTALRMQMQMSRLQQGLGQNMRDKQTELDAMALDWVVIGPVATVVYQGLVERFLKCR